MRLHFILLALLCGLVACGNYSDDIPNPQNSAYFWKTVYNPDSTELQFVRQHNIKKLYVRYFDVIIDKRTALPKPNATIKFEQVPESALEIIPTVFILDKCFDLGLDSMYKTLVDRILQISETHNVRNVHEIQLDCDWTHSSQDSYFAFLSNVREYCKQKDLRLSVTIRLHQLNMKAPDCDYGVLMLYNTGNFRDINCDNPILSLHDVSPYLKYLKDYKLPLCAALPNFKWQVLFSQGKFSNILYNQDLEDSSLYKRIDDRTYRVIRAKDVPIYMGSADYNVYLSAGDTLRLKKAEMSEIRKVKDAIGKIRPTVFNQTIIYDLNSFNINNLTTHDYEEVFTTNSVPLSSN